MKVITITGQYLNTLPLPHARPFMVGHVFKMAGENHWTIRIAGQHWER